MASISNTPRPGYVYDSATNEWIPIGVGAHQHTNAADTPAVMPYSTYAAAGKNKLLNADFNINQRAFSSVTTTPTYTFDRWIFEYSSASTNTASAQTFTASSAPVSGYESTNYIRLTSAANGSGYCALIQKIEDVRTFAGQTITVSFWVKAGSGTPKVGVGYTQTFGTGGSAIVYSGSTAQTITTSWARYSFTLSIPSIAGKTIGTGSSLSIYPLVSDTVIANQVGLQSGTFDIWGVQAEAGSVATAFQTATGNPASELAACMRYFQKIGAESNMAMAIGQAVSTSITNLYVKHVVTMRTAPSFSYTGTISTDYIVLNGTGGVSGTPTSITLGVAGTTQSRIDTSGGSGLTAGQVAGLQCSNTNASLLFSAEL